MKGQVLFVYGERGNGMYINEVLRTCDALCPNEYSDNEKYMWCDELSAMIRNEHLKTYDKVTLEAGEDGSYLLPEGITFEMVDRIIDGAREIDKKDFRSYGIEYYYGQRGRFVLPVIHRVNGKIDVVYLRKHKPIRNVEIEGTIIFYTNGFVTGNTRLCEGDSLNIKIGNDKYANVPVLSVEFTDEGCRVYVPEGTFKAGSYECEIKRIITDETVCGAPYDRMYVDFVNAQICYYQRDFDTYNQHMNLFNQRLAAYQAWLQQRRTQDKDGQLVNWF